MKRLQNLEKTFSSISYKLSFLIDVGKNQKLEIKSDQRQALISKATTSKVIKKVIKYVNLWSPPFEPPS